MGSQDAPPTYKSMDNRILEPKGKGKTNVVCDTRNGDESINNRIPEPKDKDKTKKPKTVKFNNLGQPIGKMASPFAHFLSKAAQSRVPLTIPNWYKALNSGYKDLIWDHVKKHYIVDDFHRKFCFQKMAKYWREYKCKSIKKFEEGVKSENVEVVARNTQPANVHSLADWTKFVKFSLSPEEVKRRNRFRELRKCNKLKCRKRKKSFARIEYEMKKKSENPDEITMADVWLEGYSRKKKNGDEDIEDPEVVRLVKEKMAEHPDSSQWSINDDPVSQVLGPERRGRVRGYGFGGNTITVAWKR